MPIDLFSIPEHIRDSIVQKLDLSDFLKFHQCSKKSFAAANDVKTRFTIETGTLDFNGKTELLSVYFKYEDKILKTFIAKGKWNIDYRTDFCSLPLRFEDAFGSVMSLLSEEFCSALIEFFSFTGATMKKAHFVAIACSPRSVAQLIEVSKLKVLQIDKLLSPTFMSIEAIRNIAVFNVTDFVAEWKIIGLHALKCTIKSSDLTSSGINTILKELLSGKRRLISWNVHTNQPIQSDVILDGIPIIRKRLDRWGERMGEILSASFGDTSAMYTIRFGPKYFLLGLCTLPYNIQ